MWARTLCPLLSSTRNIALGRASTTVPSISITPSFFGMSSAICWGTFGLVFRSVREPPQPLVRGSGWTSWRCCVPLIRGARRTPLFGEVGGARTAARHDEARPTLGRYSNVDATAENPQNQERLKVLRLRAARIRCQRPTEADMVAR